MGNHGPRQAWPPLKSHTVDVPLGTWFRAGGVKDAQNLRDLTPVAPGNITDRVLLPSYRVRTLPVFVECDVRLAFHDAFG